VNNTSLLTQLSDLRADIEEIEGREITYWKATFPVPDGADYAFQTYVYADGGAGISAELCGSSADEWFWTAEFEVAGYSSVSEAQTNLLEILILLLKNPTRIVQTRKLLFMHFTCDYLDEGEWCYAGGGASFRFGNFKFPENAGKKQEYRSPPVNA
jgi:hypothetical protein